MARHHKHSQWQDAFFAELVHNLVNYMTRHAGSFSYMLEVAGYNVTGPGMTTISS